MHTADEYRKKAHECQRRADEAKSPMGKSEWQRIGQQWLELAEKTENGVRVANGGNGGGDPQADAAEAEPGRQTETSND